MISYLPDGSVDTGALAYDMIGCCKDVDALVEALNNANAKLAAAEKDAARYRWLRRAQLAVIDIKVGDDWCEDLSADKMDAAIDIAMKG